MFAAIYHGDGMVSDKILVGLTQKKEVELLVSFSVLGLRIESVAS
jgi:hypothetical protein